jgi:hypothetical protein
MRAALAALALNVLALPVMADAPPDSVDFRRDDHRWEHRLLFVFAPPDTAARARQEDAFEGQAAGFRDRDLLLVTLNGYADGILQEGPGTPARPLTEAAVRRLYDHFGVPADAFRVILVGKDGTEKRRDAEPVAARSIFDTIDAMPMRQREMRDSSG